MYDTDFPIVPTTYNPIFASHIVDAAGPGTTYLWDCDNAGRLIDFAVAHGRARDRDLLLSQPDSDSLNPHGQRDFHFGACGAHQTLPVADGLPRDVFTSCMVSPVLMAMRFHHHGDEMRHASRVTTTASKFTNKLLLSIPGEIGDLSSVSGRCRKSSALTPADMPQPLGEVDWLLTVVTETIAWEITHDGLFRTLFRQDDALRDLGKGYILSQVPAMHVVGRSRVLTSCFRQRVMRALDCTPVSYPSIPSGHLHPLWRIWDAALDDFLDQIPIKVPIIDAPHEYRPPVMIEELLAASEAVLLLPEVRHRENCRIAAANLPIMVNALKHWRYRSHALQLLCVSQMTVIWTRAVLNTASISAFCS